MLIRTILAGGVAPFGNGGRSAIGKVAIDGPRTIGWFGIDGDAQADLSVHGGPDKAVHHYPFDHYPFWRATLGAAPIVDQAGAFGENISTLGIDESAACIGDRFRLGTALVEISQGRQPCWKQAHRLGSAMVVATMVRTRRCGWYYRVLETGVASAGDTLRLIERPHPGWNVARVIGLLIAGDSRTDRSALCDLSGLSVMAEGWRARAARLAG